MADLSQWTLRFVDYEPVDEALDERKVDKWNENYKVFKDSAIKFVKLRTGFRVEIQATPELGSTLRSMGLVPDFVRILHPLSRNDTVNLQPQYLSDSLLIAVVLAMAQRTGRGLRGASGSERWSDRTCASE